MRLGVRSKVFGVSLILVGLVTLVTGLLLETQLRGRLEQRIQDEFLRHARSIAAKSWACHSSTTRPKRTARPSASIHNAARKAAGSACKARRSSCLFAAVIVRPQPL